MIVKIGCRQVAMLLLSAVGVSYVGCKKFVQIGPPNTQIVTTSVFSDDNAATAALINIYIDMQSESWSMSQNAGLLSDELQSPSTSQLVRSYYTNALLESAGTSIGPWAKGYKIIYEANDVISGIKSGTGMTPAIKNQLIGEAEFIRAFWYFYLINCYGDIPLVLSTDYKINSTLSRTSKTKIYEQIISDLTDANNLLNINYVDASDTATSVERIRPNKAAASALLARIYLYVGDYANAEAQANSVLSNNQYQIVQDLDRAFLKTSKEAIWQLGTPSPTNFSTTDGFNFILTGAPAGGGATSRTATISTFLWNSFEPNDQRKNKWIGKITTINPDTSYYFPYKYKSNTVPVTEYTMMLRLQEQYLIHAESLVRQNKSLDQAAADLDSIRLRAGLGEYAGPLIGDSLLKAILHERQVELFTEWGHRWFDLIRTNNIDTVMNVVNPQKGGQGWNHDWALFPIPLNERTLDFNLTQNLGY